MWRISILRFVEKLHSIKRTVWKYPALYREIESGSSESHIPVDAGSGNTFVASAFFLQLIKHERINVCNQQISKMSAEKFLESRYGFWVEELSTCPM